MLFLRPAIAQPLYQTVYFISGDVADPKGVGTEGRKVVMFKDDPAYGFSDDYVGNAGLAGTPNKYRLNAFEDHRLAVAKGKYKVAIVKGADNYGANPVEFDITGYGYDNVPLALTLEYGAGIGDPGVQPTQLAPVIEYIMFGNRRYQKTLVEQGQQFIISGKPKVQARVVSSTGLNLSSVAMVLNEGTANAKSYSIKSSNIITAAGPVSAPTEITLTYDFAQEGEPALPEGDQKMTFKAANSYGQATELATVSVLGGAARLIGNPLTFPSPVRLLSSNNVTIQYTLSQDINIELRIIDVSGQVVKNFICNAREEGGSAGLNKVVWDLKTQQGSLVSAAIYVVTILDRDTKKMLGKARLTAIGQ